ncbi:MAG: cupin domain-containing protein [Chthoniobacterales bacterium]
MESHLLKPTRNFPNNPDLPLIIYRAVTPKTGTPVALFFEEIFTKHAWPAAWRYTMYDFAHYHSNTHEVFGVFQGHARVRFGNGSGFETSLDMGDIVIIPAGVAHQRLNSIDNFEAVGAYPEGFSPNMHYGLPDDLTAMLHQIEEVPIPSTDPAFGSKGSLITLWKETLHTHSR